ncbi:MAG TPA: tRNA dihydrouridine(20/20a) synthase DusA [Alphaproteobacteria bacterium]|nr:tRNA dihydrouridine(20/20a) synthase DusA [Alphaproteobacteria bacterium]
MHPHRFCVAPMMDWTDRFDRYFLRLLSRHARLYTEMVTANAVLHGERKRLLGFDLAEHPVALQLGGSEPAALAEAAKIGADFGYDEINLNVGCPSDRVQSGRFGACLMADPGLVAQCMAAMRAAVPHLPVTVKCRIGIDRQIPEEILPRFIATLRDAGCEVFIIHARMAWLEGLSPKQNRDVPPLDYALAHRMKAEFPQLTFVLNGGLLSLADAAPHLAQMDGVMLGRAAYQNPYLLADVDRVLFNDLAPPPSRIQTIERLLPWADQQVGQGVPLHCITRHILGLFQGRPGAKAWRRHLSENAHRPGAGVGVIRDALARVRDSELARAAA